MVHASVQRLSAGVRLLLADRARRQKAMGRRATDQRRHRPERNGDDAAEQRQRAEIAVLRVAELLDVPIAEAAHDFAQVVRAPRANSEGKPTNSAAPIFVRPVRKRPRIEERTAD